MNDALAATRVIYVGNIPFEVTEQQVLEVLKTVGPVLRFRMAFDETNGKPRGFGYCEYVSPEVAKSAVRNLRGYVIGAANGPPGRAAQGAQLKIELANPNVMLADSDRFHAGGGGGPTHMAVPGHHHHPQAALRPSPPQGYYGPPGVPSPHGPPNMHGPPPHGYGLPGPPPPHGGYAPPYGQGPPPPSSQQPQGPSPHAFRPGPPPAALYNAPIVHHGAGPGQPGPMPGGGPPPQALPMHGQPMARGPPLAGQHHGPVGHHPGQGPGPRGPPPGHLPHAPTPSTLAILQSLDSLPPSQLSSILSQMKSLVQNQPEKARATLHQKPQLAYALLTLMFKLALVDQKTVAMIIK